MTDGIVKFAKLTIDRAPRLGNSIHATDQRITAELALGDALIDAYHAETAPDLCAAFRKARAAIAPALEALDKLSEVTRRETYNSASGPLLAPINDSDCICEGESDSIGTWRSNPGTFCPEHDDCMECGALNPGASGLCGECTADLNAEWAP